MSVNDDGLTATSDSFWEIDQYKRTVKRHEDGFKLCNELMTLIQERADLEKAYAKSLKAWSHKWQKNIEGGPEYGTMEAACKGVLSEAEGVAELHHQVKERLMNEVQTSIKAWRNENFTKKLMGPSSGTKELDDLFKKAQKPWAKRYAKAMKAKKDYHTACKLEKTAIHQEGNARNDTAVSQDQLKKMQDKMDKCKRDVESTREKYEAALNDLNSYNGKYADDMKEVFNRAQDSEEKRLVFFKEMLFGIQKCLDLSDSDIYKQTNQQFYQTISQADHNKDLRWWSQNHGSDMPMNWPIFEEYTPDLHDIVKRRKHHEHDEGITLRKINMEKHHSEFPEYSPELHDINKKQKKGGTVSGDGITLTAISSREQQSNPSSAPPPAYDNYSNSVSNNEPPSYQSQTSYASHVSDMSDGYQNSTMVTTTVVTQQVPQSNGGGQNPFGDDDWDEYGAPEIDESKGVPVRALYDYHGQEDDELTFKAGDIFIKLLDADEQGWCTGKKDSKTGLYPNNYVEPV